MKTNLWNILTHLTEALSLVLSPKRTNGSCPMTLRWKLLLIRLLANWIRYGLRSKSFESDWQNESESERSPCESWRTSTDSFPTSPSDRSPTESGTTEDEGSL